MNDVKNIFSVPENVDAYFAYRSALLSAIRVYYDLVKVGLENYQPEPGKILYFGTTPCGAIAFPKHALQMMFYRPGNLAITREEVQNMDDKEEWYRGVLESAEKFLQNLPGAILPERPAIIGEWLNHS